MKITDGKNLRVIFLNITDFIGRFHPVFVHLPIGILLMACFFQILSTRNKFASLAPAVPVLIFWGMLSAILSCVTGLFLANNGEYEDEIVGRHQWSGISVAVISIGYYVLYKKFYRAQVARILSFSLIILITITGHLGGSITHGPDYLTAGLNSAEKDVVMKPIPDIQQAAIYNDVVQPLLEARCYNCHSDRKQKGKLRLDKPEFILKGGESGKAVIAGKGDESEMIERLLLPLDHDDHMPPKSKRQLNRNQIDVLEWWISTGADFTKKVNELKQTEKIKPVLSALQSGSLSEENKIVDIPDKPVKAADSADINKLKNAGVIVIPIMQGSNYLSVNFVTATGNIDQNIRLLEPLRRQIVWLNLDNTGLTDSSMATIGKLEALKKLQLSNNNISDKGLMQLQSLKELRSLNLVGTKITSKGLMSLTKLENIRYLYLYQALITSADWAILQKAFPSTTLDTGNYKLPMLASDTTEVKLK
jgi:uncharacterized membrane protein/mono/diheme cytochrome c family protein